eukprot:3141438-Amphidinium_carterae.1
MMLPSNVPFNKFRPVKSTCAPTRCCSAHDQGVLERTFGLDGFVEQLLVHRGCQPDNVLGFKLSNEIRFL